MPGLYELNDLGKRPRRQGLDKRYSHSLHGHRPSRSDSPLAMEPRQTRQLTALSQRALSSTTEQPAPAKEKAEKGDAISIPLSLSSAEPTPSESSDEEFHKKMDIKPTIFNFNTKDKTDAALSSGSRPHRSGWQGQNPSNYESAKRKQPPDNLDMFGRALRRPKAAFGKQVKALAKAKERKPWGPDHSNLHSKSSEDAEIKSQSDQENSPPIMLLKVVTFSDESEAESDKELVFQKPEGLDDDRGQSQEVEYRRAEVDLSEASQSPLGHHPFEQPHIDNELLWDQPRSVQADFPHPKVLFRHFGADLDLNIAPGATQAHRDALEATIGERYMEEAVEEEEGLTSDVRRCPMCRKNLAASEFTDQGPMTIRQQERFCRSHRLKSARVEWEIQGYPDINWSELDDRLTSHHSFIRSLINGAACHRRSILDAKVKAGKERNLLKTTGNLIPGYYGSRGLRTISEHIVASFTPLLKKRAIEDRLIAARGPTAFVQSVCVLEVAAKLVEEDLGVDAERAREILDESAAVGELVNEEQKDVVIEREEGHLASEGEDDVEDNDGDVF